MARRPLNPMPADIRQRLLDEQLMGDYDERPAYQRNDYLGWIARAKREETRQKRLDQMVDELRTGGLYMKMDHPPTARD
jgi:uncharacterized protein YdeI (YjbR/CyaY-like superfamily)